MYSLVSTFLVLFSGVHAIPSYPTTITQGMTGYAKAADVNGGWNGNVIEINSLAELKKQIRDNTTRVLIITNNITASTLTKIQLGSNKSIIGSFNKPILYNIHLRDTLSSENIIFQNLIFQHDVSINDNDDIQLSLRYGKKYWIDHCSFVGHSWSIDDGSEDKLLYVGGKADYVTISNCYFGNHKHGLILGYPSDDEVCNDEYNVRVTICYNYYENLEVRAPGLMRWGHYHVYNNYIRNYSLGFTLATGGKIISEKNYFETNSTYFKILDDKGTGQFTDTDSIPSITEQVSPKADWTAESQYGYILLTALEAKMFALARTGAQSSQLTFVNYMICRSST